MHSLNNTFNAKNITERFKNCPQLFKKKANSRDAKKRKQWNPAD